MAEELPFDRDNADRDDFRTILASFIGRISQMTLIGAFVIRNREHVSKKWFMDHAMVNCSCLRDHLKTISET